MSILVNLKAELAVRLLLWLLPIVVLSDQPNAESLPTQIVPESQITPESMQSESRAAASTSRA